MLNSARAHKPQNNAPSTKAPEQDIRRTNPHRALIYIHTTGGKFLLWTRVKRHCLKMLIVYATAKTYMIQHKIGPKNT